MEKDRLEELKALCEAASQGLWSAVLIDEETHEVWIEGCSFYTSRYPPWNHAPEELKRKLDDAHFIAAARAALPELIEEVERLGEIILDAAISSETVDHEYGTRKLREEAARINPEYWATR